MVSTHTSVYAHYYLNNKPIFFEICPLSISGQAEFVDIDSNKQPQMWLEKLHKQQFIRVVLVMINTSKPFSGCI